MLFVVFSIDCSKRLTVILSFDKTTFWRDKMQGKRQTSPRIPQKPQNGECQFPAALIKIGHMLCAGKIQTFSFSGSRSFAPFRLIWTLIPLWSKSVSVVNLKTSKQR